MKHFKFPLEKILDYRKNIEDKKAEALYQSRTKKKDEEDILELIEEEKKSILKEDKREDSNTLNELTISSDYLNQLNNEIEKSENRIKDADKEVDKKLIDLKEASIEKKAVEKLREKKLMEHKTQLKKGERKQIDEIANRTHKIKGNGKS